MYKPLEDKNKININKIEQLRKKEEYKNISPKLNYLIDYELIDIFKNILNEPKIDFLTFIMAKVKNYLYMEYNLKTFNEDMLKYLLKHSKEKLEKKYDTHLQNLTSAWDNFQILLKSKNKTNEIEKYYLKNFLYHCSATSEYAIHKCEKNDYNYGKFIKVIDKSNIKNKNQVKYVICENCRKAYFIDHFLNYCEKCEVNYFSCEVGPDKKDLHIATLKTPHCESVVNEKLYCQFCKNTLFLDVKKNQVICQKCRFVSSAKDMERKCNICGNQFKSDIIIYNKSEVNYIKKVINYGLLLKKLARPIKLPCCKNINVKTAEFYHKKDCKGIIYFAEFHKKLIIICEKCKAVNNFGKFIWTCPGCSLRFKDMKWQENEPRLRKEIFYKKDIRINIDLNDDEVYESRRYNFDFDDTDDTIEKRARSKNKSNLYDILKKRTNPFPDTNPIEICNTITHKKNKENKEMSTEGSEPPNTYNLNLELYSDKQLAELIKVKRNLEPLHFNNEQKEKIRKKNKEIQKGDDESTDRKNLKKRYIFEKLIRRQFISSNNIMTNKFTTEGNKNKSEKNILEKNKLKEKNEKTGESGLNIKKNFFKIDSTDIKQKLTKKTQNSHNNSDVKRISMNNRLNRIKNIEVEDINSQTLYKNGYQRNYQELLTDQKSLDKTNVNINTNFKSILGEHRSSVMEKNKDYKNGFIKSTLKDNESNNKNPFINNSNSNDKKLNVKRFLFKTSNYNTENNINSKNNNNNNKNDGINNNSKKIDLNIKNNNNINNSNENIILKKNSNDNSYFNANNNINHSNNNSIYKSIHNKQPDNNNDINSKQKENKINYNKNIEKEEIKINKKLFYKEYNNLKNNSECNKENLNQKEIINHCALNNTGLRKLYKDSHLKKIEKNLVNPKDPKTASSKYIEIRRPSNYNYNNYIKNNINNNNQSNNGKNSYNSNNFKFNENSFASISMKNIKNFPNKQTEDDNSQFEITNTFKKRKEKNDIKNETEKEESEEDPPDDVKRVLHIDEMETIPLNPSLIKNPLLYNNIQQRIKHLLFKGRLPLFNIDNYTIIKTLGEGTNGVIYKVTNNKTKKNYAMKKLIANTIAELDFYQKEFQICFENPHQYILNIYGVCARCFDSTTYVLYVLMALAQKDLEMEISERSKTKRYFQEKELIDMMKKLVEALYYLQKERNVAHRDIKPENILLFKNGVVKLGDFGEAKINNEKKKKTIRGTEFYMSPLLYAGNLESKYDIQHNPFKSDVFSLGYCFIYASSLDYEIINEIRKISDQDKLRQILKKIFPKIYSSRYIELLLKMIINDENQRIDFIELQNLLQNY